jgi:hypothetical protein
MKGMGSMDQWVEYEKKGSNMKKRILKDQDRTLREWMK